MDENRRKDTRYSLSSRVTVTMNDVILNDTECINISMGGMCLAINDKLDNWKDGLLILVHKFDKEVIFFSSKFRVLWKNMKSSKKEDSLIGINFQETDPKNFEFLSRIIHYQSNMAN